MEIKYESPMKTIKTAAGLLTLKDGDRYFVSLQLRSILQDHRTQLVDNLISSDLNRYIDYKFDRTANPIQLNRIKNRLIELRQSGVNMTRYDSILQSVIKYDFVQLGNASFFHEIDEIIRLSFKQTELFQFESSLMYHGN
jgi:hypothetical protein